MVAELSVEIEGAALHGAALSVSELEILRQLFEGSSAHPGKRMSGDPRLRKLVGQGSSAFKIAVEYRGTHVQAIRAVLFDKSPDNNWFLGWHQDRTIAVKERHEVQGYGPWTVKQGIHHVEPPFDILENMVTLRLHLDPVTTSNAPLLIALKSHKRGRVASESAGAIASNSDVLSCNADCGDIWAYSTPILHASEKSVSQTSRRVLQVDYSAGELPNPLEWVGI